MGHEEASETARSGGFRGDSKVTTTQSKGKTWEKHF